MKSIPFKLPDVGFSEVSGYIYFDEEFLVFDIGTSLFGEFEEEEQTIKIEPKAVDEIVLKNGMFKDQLRIRPKKHALLKAMPGSFEDEIKLKIAHKHRAHAHLLIQEFYRRVAG